MPARPTSLLHIPSRIKRNVGFSSEGNRGHMSPLTWAFAVPPRRSDTQCWLGCVRNYSWQAPDLDFFGALGRIRTCNLLIRSAILFVSCRRPESHLVAFFLVNTHLFRRSRNEVGLGATSRDPIVGSRVGFLSEPSASDHKLIPKCWDGDNPVGILRSAVAILSCHGSVALIDHVARTHSLQ
jgi:hypothetical protein